MIDQDDSRGYLSVVNLIVTSSIKPPGQREAGLEVGVNVGVLVGVNVGVLVGVDEGV